MIFFFELLIDVSRDSVGSEYMCLHSFLSDSPSPSLWFSHVSWLSVQKGRDVLLVVSVGCQTLCGLRVSASLDCVSQTNVNVIIAICNSHFMFFQGNVFPFLNLTKKI